MPTQSEETQTSGLYEDIEAFLHFEGREITDALAGVTGLAWANDALDGVSLSDFQRTQATSAIEQICMSISASIESAYYKGLAASLSDLPQSPEYLSAASQAASTESRAAELLSAAETTVANAGLTVEQTEA